MAREQAASFSSASMLLLRLLEKEDMYGYQMIETLAALSNNVFEYKAGLIYPILHDMEKKGWVESYEQIHGGRARKYYRITKGGKAELAAQLEKWNAYSGAINDVMTKDMVKNEQ